MGLFPRRREPVRTAGVSAAAVLDGIHGLDGRKRRYVPHRPGSTIAPLEGARVLAAWTDSADEATARAFMLAVHDDEQVRAALESLAGPTACRLVAEEPCAAADARYSATELSLFRAEAVRRRKRRKDAREPAALEGLPIYAVRGLTDARDPGRKGNGGDGADKSREVPERLRIEASNDFPALALLVPAEFAPTPGALARVVPGAVLDRGAAAACGARTAIACTLPVGTSTIEWSLLFPPLPPSDPGTPAAAQRFATLVEASAKTAAAFLASLKLPAGEPRIAPPVRVDAPFGSASPDLFAVEAELRLGSRDLPLLVAVRASAARFLSRISGDELAATDADPVTRFLEANRRLRSRLAQGTAKRFAARPSLAAFLRLLDDADRARLVSRLAAAFRPAELVKALYAATRTRDGVAALVPRAGFRSRDLVARAPSVWAEDFEAALASLDPAAAPSEAEAAGMDLATLSFVAGELAAGRLELSPFAKSALAPVAARYRDGRFAELRVLRQKDGLAALVSGSGRRLGATALAGVTDRALALATIEDGELREALKDLMSPGRRRAFSEEIVWVDARRSAAALDPEDCLAARAEVRGRFSARLEALREGRAARRG
ncbi:MAG: hypothetical protein JXA15_10435 [Spirochaetales bacterium]|nr:hypothetical protein [Spirochaetales bacterium]